jgi:hypothetical protein
VLEIRGFTENLSQEMEEVLKLLRDKTGVSLE